MTEIVCGKNIMSDVKAALEGCAFVVTDNNIAALYPELAADAFVIKAGESSKNPDTLLSILDEMSRRGLRRSDRIAALGGGVVGDITGFAAAVYMRGIKWTSIPTSLLAMVDSGIGGKTAVDFNGVKNLIGAFHEPTKAVVCTEFLNTLPDREWKCGTGELIKTCLLSEKAYGLLKNSLSGLLEKDKDCVYSLVEECLKIKSDVVNKDPKENGLRKILNIGHTVGHALESLDGYKLSHGEYVLKGMMTEFAMCMDSIDKDFFGEIMPVLKMFTSPPKTTAKAVCEKARSDKKNKDERIALVIPVSPSDTKEVYLTATQFIEFYERAVKELKS